MRNEMAELIQKHWQNQEKRYLLKLMFKRTQTSLSQRVESSEARKTSDHEKDQPTSLKQRQSLCSFYKS